MVRAFPSLYSDSRKVRRAHSRASFSESDTMRPPEVQMPVPAPGSKVAPSRAEPKE